MDYSGEEMEESDSNYRLELRDVIEKPLMDGVEEVLLQTDGGLIKSRLHRTTENDAAVVWVGGAGGGLEGPARGLYPRLASRLVKDQIASLRLNYRHPNHLVSCVLDTLVGISYLESGGCKRIVLVGHSFGGAVVITAGVASEKVVGVATLSSQTYGTTSANELSPRSILLMHGAADTVLPDACSRDIYRRANGPKLIFIYPGCGHGLDECREQVDRDLFSWIEKVLQ